MGRTITNKISTTRSIEYTFAQKQARIMASSGEHPMSQKWSLYANALVNPRVSDEEAKNFKRPKFASWKSYIPEYAGDVGKMRRPSMYQGLANVSSGEQKKQLPKSHIIDLLAAHSTFDVEELSKLSYMRVCSLYSSLDTSK